MEVIELLASGQRTKPIVHPCLPLSKTGDCLKVNSEHWRKDVHCYSLKIEELPHMDILLNFF